MSDLNYRVEINDALKGTRIVLRARKVVIPSVVASSGRHNAMQTHGTENAQAWIEVPARWVGEKKSHK